MEKALWRGCDPQTGDRIVEIYGEVDLEIWISKGRYEIRSADGKKVSQGYDEKWYCRRAIDQNIIRWKE